MRHVYDIPLTHHNMSNAHVVRYEAKIAERDAAIKSLHSEKTRLAQELAAVMQKGNSPRCSLLVFYADHHAVCGRYFFLARGVHELCKVG